MPLLLPNGSAWSLEPHKGANNAAEAILTCPEVIAANQAFLTSDVRTIPPSTRSIHVVQGEAALASWANHELCIGSTDATTCVIAVVVCRQTQMAWTAHFDEATAPLDHTFSDLAQQGTLQGDADVYLVGGFEEKSGISAAVVAGVLRSLHAAPLNFHLRLASILRLNTSPEGGPAALHLAVDCHSGTPYPATFADRGPELPRRFTYASMIVHGLLAPVYDAAADVLRLPGFTVHMPRQYMAYYQRAVAMSDEEFMARNSTSPSFEPPNFCDDIRAAYQYRIDMHDHHVPERSYRWSAERCAWEELTEQ